MYYGLAYQAAPDNEQTLVELLRLTERLENQADTIALLESSVEDISSIEHQCFLRETMADLALNSLNDQNKKHQQAILNWIPLE